jgi:hypothetical protein
MKEEQVESRPTITTKFAPDGPMLDGHGTRLVIPYVPKHIQVSLTCPWISPPRIWTPRTTKKTRKMRMKNQPSKNNDKKTTIHEQLHHEYRHHLLRHEADPENKQDTIVMEDMDAKDNKNKMNTDGNEKATNKTNMDTKKYSETQKTGINNRTNEDTNESGPQEGQTIRRWMDQCTILKIGQP